MTKAFSRARIEVTAEDKTKSAFNTVGKNIKSVTDTVFSLQSAIISAAGIGGMGMLIKSSLELGDELAKTSDRIGVTTESLSGMRHAASLAGVENSALDNSLEKLVVNLGKAQDGSGAAADSIEKLGLNAETLALMGADQAVMEIADAFGDLDTAADQARVAQDLFGRSGLDMINMLHGGSDALRETSEEAELLGISISRVDAAKIEAANDSFHRAQTAIKGVGMTIEVELSPYIEVVVNQFVTAAKEANGWKDEILGAIEAVVMGVAYLIDIVQGLEFAWYAGQLAFSKMAEYIIAGVEAIADPIVKLLSFIPGLGIEYAAVMDEINAITETQVNKSAELLEKLDEIGAGGRASEKVRDFFAEVQETAQEIAEEIAESVEERREGQVAALADHLGVMVDIEKDYADDTVKLRKDSLDSIENMTRMSYSTQSAMILKSASDVTSGVDQNNKALYASDKALGVASATVNSHMAATKAMATYPYPMGAAMGALAYASGMAQVASIKSTSFGSSGSGSAPSSGGSVGDIPDYDIPGEDEEGGSGTGEGFQGEETHIDINLTGSMYSKEDVRGLIMQINEEVADGVQLVVN